VRSGTRRLGQRITFALALCSALSVLPVAAHADDNEYEYEQSKGEYEEQAHQVPDDAPVEGLRGAAEPGLPENVAERIRQVEERAHEIVERRRAKQGGGVQKGAAKSAKKSAKKAAPSAKKAAKGR